MNPPDQISPTLTEGGVVFSRLRDLGEHMSMRMTVHLAGYYRTGPDELTHEGVVLGELVDDAVAIGDTNGYLCNPHGLIVL